MGAKFEVLAGKHCWKTKKKLVDRQSV